MKSVRARQALALLEPFSFNDAKTVEVGGLTISLRVRPRVFTVHHYGSGLCLLIDGGSYIYFNERREWQVALVTELQRKIVRENPVQIPQP